MNYNTQALRVTGSINVTNVGSAPVLLAAAGGLAYRLIYFKIVLSRSAAAGAWEGDLFDGTTAPWRWVLQQPNWWGEVWDIPAPGWQLAVNTNLVTNTVGTIAGPTTLRYAISYYIDSVS